METCEKRRSFARAAMAVAALGVVFGDIGTSPLYAVQTAFTLSNHAVKATEFHIFGVISLIFWALTLIVSLKYAILVMQADDEGEGGVLVLASLVASKLKGATAKRIAVIAGIVGATVFFGDSVITPAISVLSAVEGLEVAAPALEKFTVPLAVAILSALFLVQRFGTSKVGGAFGPVMLVWFACLAALGVPHIMVHPEIIGALSPHYAISFAIDNPHLFFLAMGAVVLTVTGVEALYADMGHFGTRAVRTAWFAVAYPALVVNYLGQGAMLLEKPQHVFNPFFLMTPRWAQVPVLILATLATIIASQAVISGSFSTAKQASRLGYLQNFRTVYTSKTDRGQIYIPLVNYLLFALVLMVVIGFQESTKLATAYGIAVTMTFLITSALYLVYLRITKKTAIWKLLAYTLVIGSIEIIFFSANITKIEHGGWLPLLIAAVMLSIMMFWRRWSRRAQVALIEHEGSLFDSIEPLLNSVIRTPGTAVYMQRYRGVMPHALRASAKLNGAVRENLLFVHVVRDRVPHIKHSERVVVGELRLSADKVIPNAKMVTIRVGFMDTCNVWRLLGPKGKKMVDKDAVFHLTYFRFVPRENTKWYQFAAKFYAELSRTADAPSRKFNIPSAATVEYLATVPL